MERTEFKNNIFVALVNFIVFLVAFCFIFEFTGEFLKELKRQDNFKIWLFFMGAAFPLLFNQFLADLNNIYEKIQNFFFRQTFFGILIPSGLVVLALGYFLVPKIIGVNFSKETFTFLGPAAFMGHLIYVSRANKGENFIQFIQYVFMTSMLYILGIFILAGYFKIAFPISYSDIVVEGFKSGMSSLKSIFIQLKP